MRINGTPADIDINVAPFGVAALREAWPLSGLVAKSAPDVVVAGTTYEPFADGVVPIPISRSEALKGPVEVEFADLIDESMRNRIIEVYRQAAVRPAKPQLETASISSPASQQPEPEPGDDDITPGPHRLSLGVTVTSYAEEKITDRWGAAAYRSLLAGRKRFGNFPGAAPATEAESGSVRKAGLAAGDVQTTAAETKYLLPR
jgi:hypothetical protein